MNLSEYQHLAKRTLGDACLTNLRMGVIGETGEIVDYIKKVEFHGHAFNRQKLKEELGDLVWYTVSIATRKNICLAYFDEDTQQRHLTNKMFCEDRKDLSPSKLILRVARWALRIVDGVDEDNFIVGALIDSTIRHIEFAACFLVGVTLSEILEFNNEKLLKRYPNGFEEKRSINRG